MQILKYFNAETLSSSCFACKAAFLYSSWRFNNIFIVASSVRDFKLVEVEGFSVTAGISSFGNFGGDMSAVVGFDKSGVDGLKGGLKFSNGFDDFTGMAGGISSKFTDLPDFASFS